MKQFLLIVLFVGPGTVAQEVPLRIDMGAAPRLSWSNAPEARLFYTTNLVDGTGWVEMPRPATNAVDLGAFAATHPRAVFALRQPPAPVAFSVKSVSFNWDAAADTADGLNLRKGYFEPVVTSPEYTAAKYSPALYARGQTIQIQVVFQSPDPAAMTLPIRGIAAPSNQVLADTDTVEVPFANGESDPVTFTVSRPAPARFLRAEESYRWVAAGGEAASGPHPVYVVWDRPGDIGASENLNPWHATAGHEQLPWVSALDLAMDADQGNAHGADSPEAALARLTDYFFHRHGGRYDIHAESLNHYQDIVDQEFYLAKYLWAITDEQKVTCYDQAGVVRVMGCLLGIDVEIVRVTTDKQLGFIQTAPLVGVGRCNNPFYEWIGAAMFVLPEPVVGEDLVEADGRTLFGNHCFNRYNGKVFDACAGPQLGTRDTAAYLAGFIDISTPAEAAVTGYPETVNEENWARYYLHFADR